MKKSELKQLIKEIILKENSQIKFNVVYNEPFSDDKEDDRQAVQNWQWYPDDPIIVLSILGSISEEKAFLDIKLSNGDSLNFRSVTPPGPPNQKSFAELKINNSEHDVLDIFSHNLEQYSSFTIAVLETYKQIKIFN